MKKISLRGYSKTMMLMALNAKGDKVHVFWPKEKAAVTRLEKMGLVTVDRTMGRDWWYRAAETALTSERSQ